MEKTIQKMSEMAKLAKAVKTAPELRHMPNEHDLRVALENVKFMQPYQYESITAESEGK